MKQDLILTEKLKKKTVAGMLTRTASHYPNSGHTLKTLTVVSEDWYETFKDRLTDRAFIAAITKARRMSNFFPMEKDVFTAAGVELIPECNKCGYFAMKSCDGGKANCGSFVEKN